MVRFQQRVHVFKIPRDRYGLWRRQRYLLMKPPPLSANNSDVRMKGFSSRSTVEAAIAWIDSKLPEIGGLPAETVSLFEATARILASDVISSVDVPGFARSMMDGYALHAEETYGATAYNPLPLRIVGSSFPGVPHAGLVSSFSPSFWRGNR